MQRPPQISPRPQRPHPQQIIPHLLFALCQEASLLRQRGFWRPPPHALWHASTTLICKEYQAVAPVGRSQKMMSLQLSRVLPFLPSLVRTSACCVWLLMSLQPAMLLHMNSSCAADKDAPETQQPQRPLQDIVSIEGARVSATAPESVSVPFSGYRKAMVQSMTAAAKIPTFHLCDEINMTAILQARDTLRQHHISDHPLTTLPFLIKALSLALTAHPEVNSRLSADLSHLEVMR